MLKNFIDNIYPGILEKILSIFDIKSDTIVGLWSVVILIGCIFSIVKTHEVSGPVATIFSVVITNFAGHKMVKAWKAKDQDSQGDDNGNDSTKPQS